MKKRELEEALTHLLGSTARTTEGPKGEYYAFTLGAENAKDLANLITGGSVDSFTIQPGSGQGWKPIRIRRMSTGGLLFEVNP